MDLEISPRDAQQQITQESTAAIIDVREAVEYEFARVEPSELIPMSYLPSQLERLRHLASQRDVLLLCHHGVRSLQAAMWLRGQGVQNCASVAGGLERWSVEIDPDIPRY